jgi:hypothetical protein
MVFGIPILPAKLQRKLVLPALIMADSIFNKTKNGNKQI